MMACGKGDILTACLFGGLHNILYCLAVDTKRVL
jgi:hypothetical protein